MAKVCVIAYYDGHTKQLFLPETCTFSEIDNLPYPPELKVSYPVGSAISYTAGGWHTDFWTGSHALSMRTE